MDVIYWRIWSSLLLLLYTSEVLSSYPPDEGAKWDPNYLKQMSRLTMKMSDLLSRLICTLVGLIWTKIAFSKTAINTSMITLNILSWVHAIVTWKYLQLEGYVHILLQQYGHVAWIISSTGWTCQNKLTSSNTCLGYKGVLPTDHQHRRINTPTYCSFHYMQQTRQSKMTSRGATLGEPDTNAHRLLWLGFICHTKVNKHTSGLKM